MLLCRCCNRQREVQFFNKEHVDGSVKVLKTCASCRESRICKKPDPAVDERIKALLQELEEMKADNIKLCERLFNESALNTKLKNQIEELKANQKIKLNDDMFNKIVIDSKKLKEIKKSRIKEEKKRDKKRTP
jgi:hypothetical protein